MSDFEGRFTRAKFGTNSVTDDIEVEIDGFNQKEDKIEFLDDIIKYCKALKKNLVAPKEYFVWDGWNQKECEVFSNYDDAEQECERLIEDGEHSHYEVKERYK